MSLNIKQECAFFTEEMSAAGNVENDAIASIGCGQGRITIAPFDELRQSLAGNCRSEKTEKTPCHLIPPAPRALSAWPID